MQSCTSHYFRINLGSYKLNFLDPYIAFCLSASYSLVQNLQSMGWASFWTGIYIDPNGVLATYFGFYVLVLLPLTFILSVLAAFSLNKYFGVLLFVLWLLPGVLSVFGLIPFHVDVPDSYILNDGSKYVGELYSTLGNVFFVFILGWSVITLIVHIFKIESKFKEIYDHIWYTTALTTAVFFVVDSNNSYYSDNLKESEKNITQVISLVNKQLNNANNLCINQKELLFNNGVSEDFCNWVDKAKFKFFWLSEDKFFTRHLTDSDKFNKHIPQELIPQIDRYNQLVCNTPSIRAKYCENLKFEYDRFSRNDTWPNSNYALAIIPLNNALTHYWQKSIKVYEKIEQVQNNPNAKWFFYMVLGFIAGGKVANSTRTMAGKPKPIFRFGIKKVQGFLVGILRQIICLTHTLVVLKNFLRR